MQNRNLRIDLGITPIGNTIRENISCSKCPSACCRAGVEIQLTHAEAKSLQSSGTQLDRVEVISRWTRGLDRDEDIYELATDCGNLVRDKLGRLSCGVYGESSPVRPSICQDFSVGSRGCVDIQNGRVNSGEDVFVSSESVTINAC